VLDTVERFMFGHRRALLALFVLLTVIAAWVASWLRFDTEIERQLPSDHPYAQTALEFRDRIAGLNALQIVVETEKGTIWNVAFLRKLYEVTQEVGFLPGISPESVASLWTPNTLVYQSTEGAVEGRQLIPGTVVVDQMTPADVLQIRNDAYKGGYQGRLFALGAGSAMIHASVVPVMPDGKPTDLIAVATALEKKIRERFETDGIHIRIIGFTKFVGDISDEAVNVIFYFVLAFLLNAAAVWFYCRSARLTIATVLCSAASVVWMMALIPLLGLRLHPLGLVIPFLVYIIGVSHGIQQLNLFLSSVVHGNGSEVAARRTFRRLLMPGFFAIVTVMVGFAALLLMPIPFVSDLAIIALVGMGLKLLSNLVMLPLAISYVEFSPARIEQERDLARGRERFMAAFSRDARPGPAIAVLVVALVLSALAVWNAKDVGVGHQRPGVQELWEGDRYNVDAQAITKDYALDLDTFVVVAEAPVDACVDYEVMGLIERFGVHMRGVPGVKSVMSLPEASRFVYSILQEGSLKWRVLPRVTDVLAVTTAAIPDTTGLRNADCSIMTLAIYLTDHNDETLRRVADAAEAFVAGNQMKGVTFHLATGNGGVLHAINDAVREARVTAPLLALGVISILIFAALRDWRAVPCCVAPLAVANALGLWLLSWLGLGLTVSTLPIFVLAIGIGVDYGLYLYQRIEVHLQQGMAMTDAFAKSMQEEGTAVVYTALTIALGVGCWAFSGLKFQADMGWLLAFLVLVNALGAITILPAMAVLLDRVLPRKR
jgi:predicted RND superfamily exporter protein